MGRCSDYDVCGLDDSADPSAGLCILHSRKPDKDLQAFAGALDAHRKSRGDNFTRIVFPASVDFGAASFGTAFFHGAIFLGSCDFTGATFDDAAFFHGTLFGGEANFTLTTFASTATFSRACFRQAARFHGGAFGGPGDFSGAAFEGEGDFGETSFAHGGNFSGTRWRAGATFRGAAFGGSADFNSAVFSGRPIFLQARFGAEARFSRADFAAGGDFGEATFSAPGVDFREARFVGQAIFSPRRGGDRPAAALEGVSADFRSVRIAEAGGLTLHEADLRQCRFLESDAANLRAVRARWPTMPGRSARLGVFDETASTDPAERKPWAALEQVYRDLRAGAFAQGEHELAGDFRYGELEMRRKNPATPASSRALLAGYALLGGYGERFLRPLLWAGALWCLAAVGYLACGLQSVTSGMLLDPSHVADWLRALHFSLAVMTLATPWDLVPLGCGKAVQILQHAGGPLLLTLAAHGIWRRLRR